jgi:hypothetical protein
MTHRNAEIWAERHRRLEAIHARALASLAMAALGAKDAEERRMVVIRREVVNARIDAIERRVWRALCVAEGRRKA